MREFLAMIRTSLLTFLPFLLTFLPFLLTACTNSGGPKSDLTDRPIGNYDGLKDQSVGVMIWADRGVKIDWPSIQLDLASRVQDMLSKVQTDEYKKTTFPVLPASIVRYQRDHPASDAMPVTELAPKFGVGRLIYIEIESFSTRSDVSMQMYRGNASATLRVIEVGSDGKAKVGFDESGIRATYPDKSAPEGVLDSSDVKMYEGVLSVLAQNCCRRLVKAD
jgi:hypothetical protein